MSPGSILNPIATAPEPPVNFNDEEPLNVPTPFKLAFKDVPGLNFTPIDVWAEGNYAYVAGGTTGFHIFDIADPVKPRWIKTLEGGGGAAAVLVDRGYAYIFQGGLVKISIDPPDQAAIVKTGPDEGFSAYDNMVVSGDYIWAPNFNGIGAYDPNTLELVKLVDDINVSAIAVSNGYAYVPGINELTVVDVDPLNDAKVVATMDGVYQCSDVAVRGNYAFVTSRGYDRESKEPGLYIVDISTPESPRIAHFVAATEGINKLELIDNMAYMITYPQVIQIVDISSPESAHLVNTIKTMGDPKDVCRAGNYVYVADESSLTVLDIRNPSSPTIAGYAPTPGTSQGIKIESGYAYLTGGAMALQIVDIDPIEQAHVVGMLQCDDSNNHLALSDGYAYIANGEKGLMIVDVDPPENPRLVKNVTLSQVARGVAVSGHYAFVAVYESDDPWWVEKDPSEIFSAIDVVDISNPASAHVVKTIETPGRAESVDVAGDYLYVADGDSGVVIIKYNPLESAQIVKTLPTRVYTEDVDVDNGYAYLAASNIKAGESFLYIVDVDPLDEAKVLDALKTPFSAQSVTVRDGYAYVPDYTHLQIYNVNPPEDSYRIDQIHTSGQCYGVAVDDTYAYIANGDGGLGFISLK
jgi:hypothetical protein